MHNLKASLKDKTQTFKTSVKEKIHKLRDSSSDTPGTVSADTQATSSQAITPSPSSMTPTRDIESTQGPAPPCAESDPVQAQASMGEAVRQAEDAVSQMKSTRLPIDTLASALDNASSAYDTMTTLATTGEPLLAKLKDFSLLVDKIAEIHPYAKMAWAVLSAAHKTIIAQVDRDANIERLYEIMGNVCTIVNEAELLKIQSRKLVITRMMQQTIDCGYFICSYAQNKGFWTRVMTHLISNADAQIEDYQAKFKELLIEFHDQAVRNTEITVVRIQDDVGTLTTKVDLDDMPYVGGAGFDSEKGCLPGTCEAVLDEITNWINSTAEAVPRVYLLSGAAGTGKSAIAHTVAHRFNELHRLGSFFCFNRTYQKKRRPDNVFPTVARDLADFDPQIKQALWKVIENRKTLRMTQDITAQFDNFILKPTMCLTLAGPVVVVLDALDESGDASSRQVLLSLLASRMTELPANFRILLTSRPEKDVENLFAENPHVSVGTMANFSTKDDVLAYIHAQLGNNGQHRQLLDDAQCRLLADKSEGLFQWAFTACKAIQEPRGLSPMERFQRLVSSAPALHNSRKEPLDLLYSEVLSQLFDRDDKDVMDRFKSVMGQIMTAFEPLSTHSLTKMRQQSSPTSSEDEVSWIVQLMGSLLSGVTRRSDPIRPLHTSFHDFLADAARSGDFYVNPYGQNRSLALASLQIMKTELQFNICWLDTSYICNTEMSNLAERIKQFISPHLSYSCRFWGDHLQATAFDLKLQDEVKAFLHKQFLFWLEVLSLLGAVNISAQALSSVSKWTMVHDSSNDVANFATDAQKFVRMFGSIIAQSAPHIYLSALPFAPERSMIFKHFISVFPNTPHIDTGCMLNWPATQNILKGHSNPVTSVAFSPNGRCIVSSSRDNTLCVWDAETGQAVQAPLKGHTNAVTSVSFSPDGKHIVSGSHDQTICVWDVQTGQAIRVLKGHRNWVTSVAFSPDGKHIVSGSCDNTICIWHMDTGRSVHALKGHSSWVTSVAFSPDGKHIVSGSRDKNIYVWDAATGKAIYALEGHSNWVTSVIFSPDGKLIVSGSYDNTIYVWDAERGKSVHAPMKGHSSSVTSVAFSPDGKHIVSGSHDQTICIWDAVTGQPIHAPLKGHGNWVTSVAFSPDCKRIVSGSYDNTICVWDAERDQTVHRPLKGQSNWVTSVAFSPDGRCIASGCYDNIIQVCDAETGQAVHAPLEGHSNCVTSVAFSPDGKHIVSGSYDQTICVWDVETGQADYAPLKGHSDWVSSVAFSPDSKYIVSGSHDQTICVWDITIGQTIYAPLKGHSYWVTSVAFSPNGKHIVSGSRDNTICVWDAETGQAVHVPWEGLSFWVTSVAFSPDGKCIVAGSYDSTICVWDVETGQAIHAPLKGHSSSVTSVAFSPDGKHIASGSYDKTIHVWDAKTGQAVYAPLEGHSNCVTSVAFSPDGKCIVSGSKDNTIRVWDAEIGKVMSEGDINDAHSVQPQHSPLPPVAMVPIAFSSHQDHALSKAYTLFDHVTHLNGDSRDFLRMTDGWIVGPQSQLLLWVPYEYHGKLWQPRNKLIIGADVTALDLSQFAHGPFWHQCQS